MSICRLGRRDRRWLISLAVCAAVGCTFSPPRAQAPDAGGASPPDDAAADGAVDGGADPVDSGAVDLGGPDVPEPDAGFAADAEPTDAASLADAGADTGGLGPDAAPVLADAGGRCPQDWTYSPTGFDPCTPASIQAPLDLAPGIWTYNTFDGVLYSESGQQVRAFDFLRVTQPGGATLHITSVTGLTLASEATLIVRGPDAWAVAVHGEARVLGSIKAQNGEPGTCAASDGDRASASRGGGGGGGGGYGAPGGEGGDGRGFGGLGAGGGPTATGVDLRAGCSGGAGGAQVDDGDVLAAGGVGGAAGGAVQVSARDRLSVEGQVLAVGEGGRGGDRTNDDEERGGGGGGGGGSGGDILLEAVHLVITGAVCAGGGSGGGGGDEPRVGPIGLEGACATVEGLPSDAGGRGGAGEADGPGGDGRPGGGFVTGAGGGGGGGGAGRVRVRSARSFVETGTIAPPASP